MHLLTLKTQKMNISRVNCIYSQLYIKTYVRYLPSGRAVLKTKGTVLPNTDRPSAAKIVFIFFFGTALKATFVLIFFIKETQLKSGVRARIHKKSKMSFFAALLTGK